MASIILLDLRKLWTLEGEAFNALSCVCPSFSLLSSLLTYGCENLWLRQALLLPSTCLKTVLGIWILYSELLGTSTIYLSVHLNRNIFISFTKRMCQELRNAPFLTWDLSYRYLLSTLTQQAFCLTIILPISLEQALRSPPFPLIIPTKCCQWSVLRSWFPVQAILNCLLWGPYLRAWVSAGMSASCLHPLHWHVASGFE